MEENTKLIYGGGQNPYINIVDDRDMPIPAFGPIDVPIKKACCAEKKSAEVKKKVSR